MVTSRNKAQQAFSLLAEIAAQRENQIELFRNLSRIAEPEDNADVAVRH